MVRSQVRAWARAEQRYRLLSCPESAGAAAVAAVEQLGADLAAEQIVQPTAEGAARQPTAAAATRGSNSSSWNSSSSNKQRSRIGGSPQQQLQQLHSIGQRAKYSTLSNKLNSCPSKTKYLKRKNVIRLDSLKAKFSWQCLYNITIRVPDELMRWAKNFWHCPFKKAQKSVLGHLVKLPLLQEGYW